MLQSDGFVLFVCFPYIILNNIYIHCSCIFWNKNYTLCVCVYASFCTEIAHASIYFPFLYLLLLKVLSQGKSGLASSRKHFTSHPKGFFSSSYWWDSISRYTKTCMNENFHRQVWLLSLKLISWFSKGFSLLCNLVKHAINKLWKSWLFTWNKMLFKIYQKGASHDCLDPCYIMLCYFKKQLKTCW